MKTQGRAAMRNGLLAAALLAAGTPVLFGSGIAVVFDNQQFGLLNDATGVYTQVSNLPISAGAAGLAALNGLYYLEDLGDNLFTVDPMTGAAHEVGNAGVDLDGAFAGTSTGLFEVDAESNLYSINAATGVATEIGPTGIAPEKSGQYDTSLSSDGTSLYYTVGKSGRKDELYEINVLTGLATDLGSTGLRDVTGSAFVDGDLELFEYGTGRPWIYRAPVGSNDFTRDVRLQEPAGKIAGGEPILPTVTEADGTVAPEPGTMMPAGIALLAAGLASRRRTGRKKTPAKANPQY